MEQRLIDANELELDSDWSDWNEEYTAYSDKQIKHAPTVLTIPKNPTNGDMIKALFPNAYITDHFEVNTPIGDIIYIRLDKYQEMRVQEDWWNAPYKVESEE